MRTIRLRSMLLACVLASACSEPTLGRPPQPQLRGEDRAITVTWGAAENASSYEVYYRASEPPAPGDETTQLIVTKEMSLKIEPLEPGTTYYVTIVAARGAKRSAASSIASVTTVPAAPAAPTIDTVSKTTLRISWKSVDGALDYELHYDVQSQKDKPENEKKYAGKRASQGDSPVGIRDCAPKTDCSVTLSGLVPVVPEKTYFFSLRASNESGMSGFSQESSKTIGPGPYPPAPILNTSLKSTGLGQFELTWDSVGEKASYEVLYDTDAAGAPYDCSVSIVPKSLCPLAGTTGTSLTLKDLKPDIPTADNYHFAVIPVSENGIRGCQPGEPGCTAKEATCSTEKVGCRADPPVDGFSASATAGKSAELTIKWTKLAGATGYDLLIGTATGATTGIYGTTISLGDVTEYVYAAPSGGTVYYLTIRGRNGQGVGRNATEVPATTIPSAPASLSATASYVSGNVSLKWSASTGATSYKIYYDTDSTNPEFEGKGIKEGSSPVTITDADAFANCSGGASTDRCKTLTTLTTGLTYSFAVKGVNASGEGAYSSTTTFVPLAAPTGFSADGDNQINFSWSAVTGASGYKIYSDTETNGGSDGRYGTTVTTVSSGSTTTASGTVSGGSTLYFAVTAVWSSTTSPASESAFSAQQALADAPTGFVVRGCTSQATLLWSPLSGATDYNVYYGSSSCSSSTNKTGCYNGPATPVSGTSYKSATTAACANSTTVTPGTCSASQCAATITGLTNGTTYYFSVRGAFDTKKTPFSSELSATPLAAPTGLAIASCGSTSANLSWTAVTGAASYQVCYQSTSAPSAGSCPSVLAATGATATVSSLTVGTNYFFVVDALSGSTTTSDHSSSVNTTLLAAPTNADVVSPNAGPNGRVTVSWTYAGAGTPAGYKIYYQTASSVAATCATGCITGETAQAAEDIATTEDAVNLPGVPSPLGAITTTSTTYTMTGLDVLKDYYFKIAAVTVSPLCESDLSSEVSALVGWPKTLSGGTNSTPLIDDLVTGDSNKLEVFIPDTNGNLYLFNEDGVLVGGWGPVALGTSVERSAVSGDIDGDGAKEIVFTANSTIYAYETTGVAVTNFPIAIGSALTSPVLGNLDSDTSLEIFVGAASGKIYAVNADATEVTGWGDGGGCCGGAGDGMSIAGLPAVRGEPVIADIDVGTTVQDSANEIIFGGDDGKLYVYNHNPTPTASPAGWAGGVTIATQGTCAASPKVYNGVSVSDLDGDRDVEIAVLAGTICSTVSAFHHTGATVSGWPKDFAVAPCNTCCANPWPLCPSPAAGDINGDGATDLVVPTYSGNIYVFNSSGVTLSGWGPLGTGAALRASPQIVNMDSDLFPEIVIASAASSSNILAYNYDGSAVSGYPKSAKGAAGASISVADIDSNSVPELFVADTTGRLTVIHSSAASFSDARVWPMFMRDPSHVAHVGPRLEIGWPRSLAGNVTASPAFGNLDGGTDLEVAVANVSGANGRLFTAKWNGAQVTGWTAPADDQSLTSTITLQDGVANAGTCDDAASTSVLASPALGNLDGATDTNVEAFIGTAGGNKCAYAFDHDSTAMDVDSTDARNAFDATPDGIEITAALANADGGTDTNLEAIFGSVGGTLYIKNIPAGTSVAGWPVAIALSGSCTAAPALRAAPAVGDIDDDTTDEIVVGGDNGCIYAFELTGALVGGFPLKVQTCTGGDSDAPLRSAPAIGNLNTDTKKEIVFGADNNCIYAYKDNGGLMTGFPVVTAGNVRSAPALGNLDSDTALEIVVGSDDGKIYALNGDGTALSGWPVDLATAVQNSPALVDVNGDGNLDIVVAVGSRMYAYDRTGTSLPGFPFLLGGPVSTSSPQAGDLRNDRTLHLSVGTTTDNRLYLFSLGFGSYNPNNCKGWLGFHNAQERTGVNTSPSTCP